MQQMRFRRVAIIIKSTYIPLHTTGLRVLRKPSSEPGSPESEHRIGTSHDNGIKLELSIQASATHVEERTARMTDLERIRAKFAAEYGLSEDMLRNAERWTETTGDLGRGSREPAAGHSGNAIWRDRHRYAAFRTLEHAGRHRCNRRPRLPAGWRVRYGRGSVPRPFARPVSDA